MLLSIHICKLIVNYDFSEESFIKTDSATHFLSTRTSFCHNNAPKHVKECCKSYELGYCFNILSWEFWILIVQDRHLWIRLSYHLCCQSWSPMSVSDNHGKVTPLMYGKVRQICKKKIIGKFFGCFKIISISCYAMRL